MGFYQYRHSQQFNKPIEQLWNFISNPANLKHITPDYMGFDITSEELPNKIYEGLIISYKVSPLMGIKTTWVTEIKHMSDNHFFVDEQRVGPYKLWHHQHILESIPEGTLMRDIVSYQPPLSILGNIANKLIIKKKLEEIFTYRSKQLNKLFLD